MGAAGRCGGSPESVHGDLAVLHVEREARAGRAVAVVLRAARATETDERRHVGGIAGAVVLHLPPDVEADVRGVVRAGHDAADPRVVAVYDEAGDIAFGVHRGAWFGLLVVPPTGCTARRRAADVVGQGLHVDRAGCA